MKSPKKGCLIAFVAFALIIVALYIPVWIDDAEARKNRSRVNELISVGQNLEEAERTLRESGFRLFYDEPIKPTFEESYLHQLVIIGNTRPNSFETFGYATGLSWMPFIHSESAYVSIDADLDGIITEID